VLQRRNTSIGTGGRDIIRGTTIGHITGNITDIRIVITDISRTTMVDIILIAPIHTTAIRITLRITSNSDLGGK
jgi:hypothetical protein